MTYEIGKNCDILLVHKDVNGGDPTGFVFAPDPSQASGTISIQRENSGADEQILIFFTLVLADELINPDGSQHGESRAEMYAALLEYLQQGSGLALVTGLGTFMGIGPLGHSATELHMVNGSFISIKLANVTDYRPPVAPDLFFACVWQGPDNSTESARTWETSIWR